MICVRGGARTSNGFVDRPLQPVIPPVIFSSSLANNPYRKSRLDDTRDRINFESVSVNRRPDGRYTAEVVLGWSGVDKFVGKAERDESETAELECSAEATIRALEVAVDQKVKFELLGVQAVKQFDVILVVVSISSRLDEQEELLTGSCLSRGKPNESAARAVLKATNRLVRSNFIYLH